MSPRGDARGLAVCLERRLAALSDSLRFPVRAIPAEQPETACVAAPHTLPKWQEAV
ncbi:TPA: hypothetical protein ACFP4Y_001031 [Neisseria bacilliformis]